MKRSDKILVWFLIVSAIYTILSVVFILFTGKVVFDSAFMDRGYSAIGGEIFIVPFLTAIFYFFWDYCLVRLFKAQYKKVLANEKKLWKRKIKL